MRKPAALAAVAALFLVGVLVGVLGTHLFYVQRLRQPGGMAELGTSVFAGQLERRLDLTSEQEREVERILAQTRSEAQALRREIVPEIRAILERTHERLDRVLTPEQRRELQELRRRQRRIEGLFLAD